MNRTRKRWIAGVAGLLVGGGAIAADAIKVDDSTFGCLAKMTPVRGFCVELKVSASGSKIDKRGYVDVINQFGGNCFGCHVAAKPRWDLICEQGHGCGPIPVTRAQIEAIQKADPRCAAPENAAGVAARDAGRPAA